jgi:hypothetical protein
MEPFSSIRTAVRWRVALSREMDERLNVLFGVLKGASRYLAEPELETRAREQVQEFDSFRSGAHALEFKLRSLLWEASEKSPYYRRVAEHLQRYPRALAIENALNQSRVEARLWLMHAVKQLNTRNIVILEGGIALFAALLVERSGNSWEKIISLDTDPENIAKADRFLVAPGFQAITASPMSISYEDKETLVVNLACDRGDFFSWWKRLPEGQLLLLQSSDRSPDLKFMHRVDSLEAFQELAPMREIQQKSIFPGKTYNRFLLLGRK